MFSVTKTGKNCFPLCTFNVSPMKSGVMVDLRDQVLIGIFDFAVLALDIFSKRFKSTNGPFFIERAIYCLLLLHGAAVTAHNDEAVGLFGFPARAIPFRENAPWRGQLLPPAT